MKVIHNAKISPNKMSPKVSESIYDITINALNGDPINLNDYKGKFLLFVNVASQCGFTQQYKDLQKLSDTYANNLGVN